MLTGLGAAVKCFGNHLGFARSLDVSALGSCVWGADRAFGIRVPGSIAMSGVPRSNRVWSEASLGSSEQVQGVYSVVE